MFNHPTRRTRKIECKQDASRSSHQFKPNKYQMYPNVSKPYTTTSSYPQDPTGVQAHVVLCCVVQASLFLQPRILKPLMEKDSLVDHDKFGINLKTAHTRANSTQFCGPVPERSHSSLTFQSGSYKINHNNTHMLEGSAPVDLQKNANHPAIISFKYGFA